MLNLVLGAGVFSLLPIELFWRFQAGDSGNRAIRDSQFCPAKVGSLKWSRPHCKGLEFVLRTPRPAPGVGTLSAGNSLINLVRRRLLN